MIHYFILKVTFDNLLVHNEFIIDYDIRINGLHRLKLDPENLLVLTTRMYSGSHRAKIHPDRCTAEQTDLPIGSESPPLGYKL